jgi:hypothetical protein
MQQSDQERFERACASEKAVLVKTNDLIGRERDALRAEVETLRRENQSILCDMNYSTQLIARERDEACEKLKSIEKDNELWNIEHAECVSIRDERDSLRRRVRDSELREDDTQKINAKIFAEWQGDKRNLEAAQSKCVRLVQECSRWAGKCGVLGASFEGVSSDVEYWLEIALMRKPWWMRSDHPMPWALNQISHRIKSSARILREYLDDQNRQNEQVGVSDELPEKDGRHDV